MQHYHFEKSIFYSRRFAKVVANDGFRYLERIITVAPRYIASSNSLNHAFSKHTLQEYDMLSATVAAIQGCLNP